MKTHPGIINHNAAIVSSTIMREEAPSKTQELAQTVFNNAVAQKYQSPIQLQAAAVEISNSSKDPAAAKAGKLLADAAELPRKLPVFDTQRMKDDGAPEHLVAAAEHVNNRFVTGTDSASMQAQADAPQEQPLMAG